MQSPLRPPTKSAGCRLFKKLARQGSKLARKGVYTDVNDRRVQVQLTQEAENPAFLLDFLRLRPFSTA